MKTATLNEQNIEKIERLITLAEDQVEAAKDVAKKHAWLACRDHLLFAAACLRREVPQYDRAGAHLVEAHKIMAQEVRA